MIRLLEPSTAVLPQRPLKAAAPPRIAILGCGNVGAEVARHLQSLNSIEICSVLVRDISRERPIPHALLTDSFDDVLAAKPDLVIELLGGLEPARSFIAAALLRGIHIVTANKSIVARHGQALQDLARRHSAQFRCEAAVGAGVPVLAAIDQLRGDRITAIRGIVNGTCNFILEQIEKGCTPGEALAEAQRLGFAEPDPSADITGRDSAEKLCVLAQRAGWEWISPDAVCTQGIEAVTSEDVIHARQRRCVIRLVAEAQRDAQGGVSLRVGPTFVPRSHFLAGASGCENAFEFDADHAGTIRLYGRGAGARPTASAVISDLLAITPHLRSSREFEPHHAGAQHHGAPAAPRRYYIRVQAPASQLTPDHVLGALAQQQVGADTTELLCDRTVLHTQPIDADRATRVAEALTHGGTQRCLVAPYVED